MTASAIYTVSVCLVFRGPENIKPGESTRMCGHEEWPGRPHPPGGILEKRRCAHRLGWPENFQKIEAHVSASCASFAGEGPEA